MIVYVDCENGRMYVGHTFGRSVNSVYQGSSCMRDRVSLVIVGMQPFEIHMSSNSWIFLCRLIFM
jgi:hypothetical protein